MASEAEPARTESAVSADLVARIASGDRAAEQEMYGRYARGLVFLVKHRTGDHGLAEDVCHNTFITAIEKLRQGAIDKPESLAGYLRGIAENKLTGNWRKDVRRGTTVDSEAIERAIDERQSPMDEVSSNQTQAAIRRLLDELPVARDRDILISVYLRDEDRESICRRHDVDAQHLNRVLSRARQRFRELVEEAEKRGRFRLIG